MLAVTKKQDFGLEFLRLKAVAEKLPWLSESTPKGPRGCGARAGRVVPSPSSLPATDDEPIRRIHSCRPGGRSWADPGGLIRATPHLPPPNPLSPPLTHPRTLHPSDGSHAGASFRQLGGTSLVSTLVFGVPQSSTGRISAVPKGRVLCLGPTPIGASWESGLTSPSFSRERPGNLGRPGPEPHANGPHISPRLVTSSLE